MGDDDRVDAVVAHRMVDFRMKARPDRGVDVFRSDIGDLPPGEIGRDTQAAGLPQIVLNPDLAGSIIGAHGVAGLACDGATCGKDEDTGKRHESRPNLPAHAFNRISGN